MPQQESSGRPEEDGTTFGETRALIRRGRHALAAGLAEIARLSSGILASGSNHVLIQFPTRRGMHKEHVGQHQLAFIARELIFSSHDHNGSTLSQEEIGFYANQYTSILDAEHGQPDDSSSREKHVVAMALLFRMDYEQMAYQTFFAPAELARTAEIYMAGQESLRTLPFTLEDAFREIHRLSIPEFLALGFALFTISNNPAAPLFLESRLCPSSGSALLIPEVVNGFLSDVSLDYGAFRTQVRQEESLVPGFEKYAFNPLHKWPVIRTTSWDQQTGEAFLVAPLPILVVERITQGLYWDFMDWWSAKAQTCEDAIDFPGLHGVLFELYVGRLLSDYYHASDLIPEVEYGPKGERKRSCDWIALEGDTAVLIECKTGRFSKRSKTTGDWTEVYESTKRTLGKAFVQLVRTKRAIGAGEIDLGASPDKFLGIVVTLDHLLLSADFISEDAKRSAVEVDPTIGASELGAIELRVLSARLLEDFCELIPELGLQAVFDRQVWESRVWTLPSGQRLPNLLRARWESLVAEIGTSLFPDAARS